MRENKMEFIKALEDLCHKTRALEDLRIKTGYINYDQKDKCGRYEFVTTEDANEITHLLFVWKEQDPLFGVRKCIDGDSNFGILIDAVETLNHMV